MELYLIIPFGIIALIVLIVGGIMFQVALSIEMILFVIWTLFLMFMGIKVIVKGIKSGAEENNLLWSLTEFVRGIFLILVVFLTFCIMVISCGNESAEQMEKVKIIIWGSFGKHNYVTICLFISFVWSIIGTIPHWIAEQSENLKVRNIVQFIGVFVICGSCVLAFDFGFKNEFINSENTFNWESPEYQTTGKTDIKHDVGLQNNGLTTGLFKEGTKLYSNDNKRNWNNIEYYEVTDGKRVGYLSDKNLEKLVKYSYYVNKDTSLYGYEIEKNSMAIHPKEMDSIEYKVPTSPKIGKLKEGTKIIMTGTSSGDLVLIQLENGTEGFVNKKRIKTVRKKVC